MRHQGNRGFTLLEVLAALLILATAIFAALQIQGQAVGDASRVRKLALAQAAAESALDEFLAAPEFYPADTTFQSEETVELPGYEQSGLVIRRIITEHTPLEDQESLDVLQETQSTAGDSTASTSTSLNTKSGITTQQTDSATTTDEEELVFDPGTFISIRVEVRDERQPEDEEPLVALETWLPKPLVEEQTATPAQSSSPTGGATPSGVRTTGSTQGGRGTGTRTSRGQQPNAPTQGGQGTTQPGTQTYPRSGNR